MHELWPQRAGGCRFEQGPHIVMPRFHHGMQFLALRFGELLGTVAESSRRACCRTDQRAADLRGDLALGHGHPAGGTVIELVDEREQHFFGIASRPHGLLQHRVGSQHFGRGQQVAAGHHRRREKGRQHTRVACVPHHVVTGLTIEVVSGEEARCSVRMLLDEGFGDSTLLRR
ncbi:hypothetical protein TU94_00020 [Streptomyces cyaneogriseus subsp. noncyanogenus]|uniref:Uncharacterized protein n=1 Tax=Streptomyces cyaneogriseus subsp. noncyanogenus TaxID=477245 RepID=A0A0C5FKD5_9ACTN|nr:hypothetical protein TU94_00020 [Streptomyces cyaneogriseus subsp. noncyanogenus]